MAIHLTLFDGNKCSIFNWHSNQLQEMVLPDIFKSNSSFELLHYYQGIMIIQIALTLLLFLILRIIHYIKWGHDYQMSSQNKIDEKKDVEMKQSQSKEVEKKEVAAQSKQEPEAVSERKWDQKAWDIYFPIIFSYHVGSISLIIIYIPYIYSAVIAFLHFACFVALTIVNIFVKDEAEAGFTGSRTKGTRIIWGIMCLLNVMLLIGGLSGVVNVLS